MTAPVSAEPPQFPADSLRQALREVFARPEYHWTERHHTLAWLWTWWRRLMRVVGAWDVSHPVLARVVFWGALVSLIAILVHFAYVGWRIYRATVQPTAMAAGLAAASVDDAGDYRERADRLARAGHFTEALAYRFVALLLELQRARAVRFDPSKTPAEYVGEARLDADGHASFARLVERLYRHVFAAVPCDDRAYRDFGDAAEWVAQHVAPA